MTLAGTLFLRAATHALDRVDDLVERVQQRHAYGHAGARRIADIEADRDRLRDEVLRLRAAVNVLAGPRMPSSDFEGCVQ